MPGAARAPKVASATLAVLVGLGGAVIGWSYFTSTAGSQMVRPASEPVPAKETAFVPADQPEIPPAPAAPAASPTPAAGRPVPVKVARACAEHACA
jgi:hypothetical protein